MSTVSYTSNLTLGGTTYQPPIQLVDGSSTTDFYRVQLDGVDYIHKYTKYSESINGYFKVTFNVSNVTENWDCSDYYYYFYYNLTIQYISTSTSGDFTSVSVNKFYNDQDIYIQAVTKYHTDNICTVSEESWHSGTVYTNKGWYSSYKDSSDITIRIVTDNDNAPFKIKVSLYNSNTGTYTTDFGWFSFTNSSSGMNFGTISDTSSKSMTVSTNSQGFTLSKQLQDY